MPEIRAQDPDSLTDQGFNHPQVARRTWRTDDVASNESFSYFCDAVCESFMELTPSRTSTNRFSAVVESATLPAGRINKVRANSHSVKRTQGQIHRATEPFFYLNIQLRSQCTIHQGSNQVRLNQGQLALFNGTKPFEIHHPLNEDMAMASLQIPLHAVEMAAHTCKKDVARLGGVRVSDHPSLGPLVVGMMRTLVERSSTMTAIDTQVLFDSLIRLSVAACASSEEDTPYKGHSVLPPLLVAIMEFIDQNLGNPELSLSMVSAQFGVTPRYIHKVFEQVEPSFSQYVRDRRLDQAAISLRNPENARATISEVALDNGFLDLSNFNRRFKERFGSTPKEMRK